MSFFALSHARPLHTWCQALCTCFIVTLLLVSMAAADSARLATFEHQGQTFFALSVTAALEDVPTGPSEIVILVDTSASQTGVYREDSIESLRALLAGLSADDHVRICAVDLQTVPMHDAFVPSDSAQVEAAIAAILSRAPLGATDMSGVLTSALRMFSSETARQRHIVYLGDGFSRANLLGADDLRETVHQLIDRHVSVSSFAIGPNRDIVFLAALANQTGGNLFIDTEEASAQQVGASLAETCAGIVFWPANVSLPQQFAETLPLRMPPIRSDRDTILIGKMQVTSDRAVLQPTAPSVELKMEGSVAFSLEPGTSGRTLSYQIAVEPSNDDFSHLPRLVELARVDGGITLPTVGSAGMLEARRVLLAGAEDLSELSNQALAVGDTEGAGRLSDAALQRDPGNTRATLIRNEAEQRAKQRQENLMQFAEDGAIEPAPAEGDIIEESSTMPLDAPIQLDVTQVPVDEAPSFESGQMGVIIDRGNVSPMFEDPPAEFESENELLIDAVEARRRAREGVLRAEVRTGLSAARRQLSSDPTNTVRDLKILLDNVLTAPDISDDIRVELRALVQSAIQEGMRQELIMERRDQLVAESRATAMERERIVSATRRRDEQLRTILNRFNRMMAEGRYDLATEAATVALEIAPNEPAAIAAAYSGFMGTTYAEIQRIRDLRQRNFTLLMVSVENAAIPFIDEPPLVYPPADEWAALTARRKPYATADVATRNPAEERITKQLDVPTEFEFFETPLEDAMTYLEERHGIGIELDNAALEQLGLDSSFPITKKLAGISLKSALRQILRENELTYVIRDEVLMITSQEEADTELITRVYPVGDLVIPIISGGGAGLGGVGGIGGGGFGGALNGGGGGGFGGGGGGFGGGGGGFGGGGGGFGGGGGGFGGGGFGGGGLFDIDDPLTLGKGRGKAQTAASGQGQPDAKVEKPIISSRKGVRLNVSTVADESLSAAWTRFFREQNSVPESQRVSDADVQVTVYELMNEKKFAESADVIQGALVAGMPQPWMFEALGMALQLQDAPLGEIERAVMSAVDLSNNVDEVFYAASYLARIGLEKRALTLLQDLVQLNPFRTEPIALAMQIARKANDRDALRWSSLAGLQQAWQAEQSGFAEEARRTAQTLVLTLEQDGLHDEAESLRHEIAQARQRDCEVKITWSGEADLDLVVQEPGGTVCSLRNPRTTSGGVLLDDVAARWRSEARKQSAKRMSARKDLRARTNSWFDLSGGKSPPGRSLSRSQRTRASRPKRPFASNCLSIRTLSWSSSNWTKGVAIEHLTNSWS